MQADLGRHASGSDLAPDDLHLHLRPRPGCETPYNALPRIAWKINKSVSRLCNAGNGGAFSSFTQGCPRDCTDENGELYPDFGFCERDEFGNLLDPDCREQPNPNWPGSGQYDGAGGTRGIEPMGFSSSLMAYVGTIGSIGSTFGIWIFKRYHRHACTRHPGRASEYSNQLLFAIHIRSFLMFSGVIDLPWAE